MARLRHKNYIRLLRDSYLSQRRKVFRKEDFRRLLGERGQWGIFDRPTVEIGTIWIVNQES